MRVAIIGCSFSDYYCKVNYNTEEYIKEGSWTFQLSNLYPQHVFTNYSKVGVGTDYHRLCFDDCYEWADLIILQRSMPGRRNMFLNVLNNDQLEWNVENINDKYSVVRTNLGVATWTGSTYLDHFADHSLIPHFDKILKTLEDLHPYVAITSPLMEEIDNKWYQNVSNDTKVQVISFNPKDKFNAWQVFPNDNDHRSNIKTWYEMGYVVGENDEHCTEKGHTKVLNEYILPLVKNHLTS